MKKRITLILSAVFAMVIMVCGATAAFAAEDKTVNWYFGDQDEYYEYWTYAYAGEAKLGTNEISESDEEYEVYFDFEVENSGYYLITCDSDCIGWIGLTQKIENNAAYGVGSFVTVNYGRDIEVLYYLEKGATYVGVDLYCMEDEYSFEIEYVGSEITDIDFEEGTFEDLIIDWDVYDFDEEYYIYCDAAVKFSSGKTIKIKDETFTYTIDNGELRKGENKITVDFLGYEKNLTMTACTMDKFIEKIEMTNIEDYCTAVEYYDGYVVPEIYDEKITVYFTDGTQKTYDFEYGEASVKLPNGRTYYAYSAFVPSRNTVELTFFVADNAVSSYECQKVSTDFLENFKRLHENKVEIINYTTANIRYAYADYIYYSCTPADFVENFPWLIENASNESLMAISTIAFHDIGFWGYITTGEIYI